MAVSMQWKLLAAAAAFTALVFGACGDDSKGGDDDDKKVDSGTNSQTDGGGILSGLPFADLDDGVAGKSCGKDEDCGGSNGSCNLAPNQTVGTCTGLCQQDAQCGAGGKCISASFLGQTAGFCQKVCSDASQCGADQECRAGVDIANIVDGLDAGVSVGDAAAQFTQSTCQAKPKTTQLGNGVAGTACTEGSSTCGEGRCMTSYKFEIFGFTLANIAYPGGYCTGDCLDNTQCGTGAACVGGSAQAGTTGLCLVTCTTADQCRAGYTCSSFDPRMQSGTTGPKYCVPGSANDAGVQQDSGTQAQDASTAQDATTAGDSATSDAGA